MKTPTKEIIYTLFKEFIERRPGLDPMDYGNGISGFRLYRNEANRISEQQQQALHELELFKWVNFNWDALQIACQSAFSGRLSVCYHNEKCWYINYIAGQYYPTEYRLAAKFVLEYYLKLVLESR